MGRWAVRWGAKRGGLDRARGGGHGARWADGADGGRARCDERRWGGRSPPHTLTGQDVVQLRLVGQQALQDIGGDAGERVVGGREHGEGAGAGQGGDEAARGHGGDEGAQLGHGLRELDDVHRRRLGEGERGGGGDEDGWGGGREGGVGGWGGSARGSASALHSPWRARGLVARVQQGGGDARWRRPTPAIGGRLGALGAPKGAETRHAAPRHPHRQPGGAGGVVNYTHTPQPAGGAVDAWVGHTIAFEATVLKP